MNGTRLAYGKLVGWRCRWGCSGMLKATGGYKTIPIPKEEPTEDELLEYKAQMDPWQLREHSKSYAGLVPSMLRPGTLRPGTHGRTATPGECL